MITTTNLPMLFCYPYKRMATRLQVSSISRICSAQAHRSLQDYKLLRTSLSRPFCFFVLKIRRKGLISIKRQLSYKALECLPLCKVTKRHFVGDGSAVPFMPPLCKGRCQQS